MHSYSQSTFVPDRSILDNALVAFEVIHHMKTDHRRSNNNVVLKLDTCKTYDRIGWVYMKEVMLKFGFSPQWVLDTYVCRICGLLCHY